MGDSLHLTGLGMRIDEKHINWSLLGLFLIEFLINGDSLVTDGLRRLCIISIAVRLPLVNLGPHVLQLVLRQLDLSGGPVLL